MKNFVKKYRFLLILAVMILIAVGALAARAGRKPPERTTLDECRSLLEDPEMNGRLTSAASILLQQQELKNDVYFAQEEQAAMLDAFSLLKGLTMIKYEGTGSSALNIELAGENYSRIKLFFLPHTQGDPEAALIREEYAPAAYYEIVEVDTNWYIGVHKPDIA